MSPQAIKESAAAIDLSGRVAYSTTVAASPSGSTETVVASVVVPGDIAVVQAVLLVCWLAFTVGASGVSARLRIRQTDINGTTKGDTGLTTAVAGQLGTRTVLAVDTAGLAGMTYAATLTIGSGGAASTVSSVLLAALAV